MRQPATRDACAGRLRSRPKGTWEMVPIPFLHIWSFKGDQVCSVFDYFAGIEVRRRGLEKVRRRIRWWRRPGQAEAAG